MNMQVWEKLGLLYQNENLDFTHASVPIVLPETLGLHTVFFTARNKQNQSVPFSLSLNLNTLKITEITQSPLLLAGNPGTFDSDGVMPTCIMFHNETLYMYYIGWNRAIDVPFRNAIGVALSKDRGKIFSKAFNGPLLDRSIHDPCFVASCDILKEGDKFYMWYLSALKWVWTGKNWKHFYHIKHAISTDLITWTRSGRIAIDFSEPSEYAISTPRVIKDKLGLYKMWYSYRGGKKNQTYRIGYAESENGLTWIRKDDDIFLPLSRDGWDSEMICYPCLFEYKNDLYMLYNGNGYGKTGFGLAVLKK
jgi:hypothetical protein